MTVHRVTVVPTISGRYDVFDETGARVVHATTIPFSATLRHLRSLDHVAIGDHVELYRRDSKRPYITGPVHEVVDSHPTVASVKRDFAPNAVSDEDIDAAFA